MVHSKKRGERGGGGKNLGWSHGIQSDYPSTVSGAVKGMVGAKWRKIGMPGDPPDVKRRDRRASEGGKGERSFTSRIKLESCGADGPEGRD